MHDHHKPKDDAASPPAVRRISSRELFAGAHRIEIEHRGVIYRLQITKQGKLILTK